ncbi:MAG: hypothetical protein J5604_04585 [Bacteroidales bacterium]|nr:hypothetical protein [Bacteroidales bacterium]
MKTIKYILVTFVLMATLFSACTKEDKKISSENKEVTLVTTLAPSPGISTKTVMNETSDGTISTRWEVGDKIWVKYINTSDAEVKAQATVIAVDGSGNATISVTMTDPKNASTITFGFPYNYWNDEKDLKTGQIGTLNDIKDNYAASSGTGTLTVSSGVATLPTGVTMTPSVCIWKLSFTDGSDDITSSVTKLSVRLISGATEKYVITPTSQSEIYVAISGSATPTAVRITAKTASGVYMKEANSVTLASGNFYRTSSLALARVYYFSVSSSKYVLFAPGNLQYLGNADGSGSWRFAEHQYDFLGDGPSSGTNYQGNVTVAGFTKYNESGDKDVVRDVFGWGTSGYNDKYPYMTSTNSDSYYRESMVGEGANYDWGVYHSASGSSPDKITNGGGYSWRLWTSEEMSYLLNRSNLVYTSPTYRGLTKKLYCFATLRGVTTNDIKGLVIFPDGWIGDAMRNIVYEKPSGGSYENNVFDADDWTLLEGLGCIFLPAAHVRDGNSFSASYLNEGHYWTSTSIPYGSSEKRGGCLEFWSGSMLFSATNDRLRKFGQSVRLIREIEID